MRVVQQIVAIVSLLSKRIYPPEGGGGGETRLSQKVRYNPKMSLLEIIVIYLRGIKKLFFTNRLKKSIKIIHISHIKKSSAKKTSHCDLVFLFIIHIVQ